MKHVVFQPADAEVLQKAIELDETLEGEIIVIKDDFAVGPIEKIYETEGYQQRKAWWETLLEFSPYTEQLALVDDKLTVHNLIKYLSGKENEEDEAPISTADRILWIWMGQNAHDVSGYYWLMSQLKDYQGQIQVLYLNNLPFINEKGGIFYPSYLFEIQPREFLKARKLNRTITPSEFEVDPDEWKKLCNENAIVRMLEGGKKIVSKEDAYYDQELLAAVKGEGNGKLPKVITTALSKMKTKTGDVFLVWRIRQLAEQGKLEVQGDWTKGWKEIVVRPAGFAAAAATAAEASAEANAAGASAED
ncbi:DUF1835 domain-containing protein [Filimonas effusa]|uniref:DUF1835 domain-containing protein n=1 Tax=Filimonas effusa TaxID=2508721 RepID=A0A4Q1DBT7_9BACT|nr:DUF1835 domain-containing protein [Filimonas effusa]RXK86931.1 DUF1835 domain-containing protein [Filimonas effusa]